MAESKVGANAVTIIVTFILIGSNSIIVGLAEEEIIILVHQDLTFDSNLYY